MENPAPNLSGYWMNTIEKAIDVPAMQPWASEWSMAKRVLSQVWRPVNIAPDNREGLPHLEGHCRKYSDVIESINWKKIIDVIITVCHIVRDLQIQR